MPLKAPHQCWSCDIIRWSSARVPKCPECKREMRLVSKSRCNGCGRELINEKEDQIGLCKGCTG